MVKICFTIKQRLTSSETRFFVKTTHARRTQDCDAEVARDDHYPVCRLDIRQDSEFATGYGYPKSALKREPDTDPDIRYDFRKKFW